MLRTRTLLLACLVVGSLCAAAASAQACTATWTGAAGDGLWTTAGNWSPAAVPGNGNSPDVCLPDLGKSYVVTLAPANGGGGFTVNSLTIGTSGASHSETLAIVGQSFIYQGETLNGEGLGIANGGFAKIEPSGTLLLDSTGGGERKLSSEALGGPAAFGDSPFGGGALVQNYGHILAESSDPAWGEELNANLLNEPGASISVASGTLDQETSNTLTNDGTLTTEAGAVYDVTSGGTNDVFVNDGTLTNDGTFEVQGQTGTFTQNGALSANPVQIDSAILDDESGTGAFTIENLGYGTPALTGTIPAGQTVTVLGSSYVSGGETQNGTGLSLQSATLVNDGTLVLDATAAGAKALASDTLGGGVTPFGGSLANNGALDFEVEDPTWSNGLEASVANSHAATVSIAGGLLQGQEVGGVTLTNDGTVTLAPTALWTLFQSASFKNEADGTLAPQIAGASSFGSLKLYGTLTAAGTVAPVLVGGYTPATGQELALVALEGGTFAGTFGALSNGFSADYSHEAASPAFMGIVYGQLPSTGPPGSAPPPPPQPPASGVLSINPNAKVLVGGIAKLKLSCAGTAGARCTGTLTLTAPVKAKVKRRVKGHTKEVLVTKLVRVGVASYSLPAGSSLELSVKLSGQGMRLLNVAREHKLSTRASTTPARTVKSVLLTGTPPKRKRR